MYLHKSRQQGVTLIELMVGMVVGLLTTLLITQVLATAESQRRTAVTGNSAQVSGALAIYSLQHDIQMSGYGITMNPTVLGCTINGQSTNAVSMTLAPVTITFNATAGYPDQITTLSGNKAGALVPLVMTEDHPNGGASFVVLNSFSASVGDTMIATPLDITTRTCSMFTVTGTTATAIEHAATGTWNNNLPGTFPASGYQNKSTLLNLGPAFVQRRYQISANMTLQTQDRSPTTGQLGTAQDAFPDIVNMRALYGMDTNGDNAIDSYSNTTPTTNAQWKQVIAVRIAILARSSEREKAAIHAATPDSLAWSVRNAPADAAMTAYQLKYHAADDTSSDWQYYRYKLYDTVIPLRNALWRDQ